MRRAVIVVVALVIALTGCAGPGHPGSGVSPAPPSTAPVLLIMPDVVGQNAAVALDALHKKGFTDIDLGTVDGHRIVVLPQNWTVQAQSAGPGTRIAADTKIVLGCARIGADHHRWPLARAA